MDVVPPAPAGDRGGGVTVSRPVGDDSITLGCSGCERVHRKGSALWVEVRTVIRWHDLPHFPEC
jgi:hypothetical protein